MVQGQAFHGCQYTTFGSIRSGRLFGGIQASRVLTASIASLMCLVACCQAFSTRPPFSSKSLFCKNRRDPSQSQLLYADNSDNSNSVPYPIFRREDADRWSIESDHVSRIRSSTTSEEMIRALEESVAGQAGDSSRQINNLQVEERIIKALSPNVVAASLRKITLFMNAHHESDTKALKILMMSLVDHLSDTVVLDEGEPFFTVYALVDVFCSLADLEKEKQRSNDLQNEDNDNVTNRSKVAMKILTLLDRNRREMTRQLNPTRLVDALYALHILCLRDPSICDNSSETQYTQEVTQHHNANNVPSSCTIAERMHLEICQTLSKGNSLSQLSPGDMSIALKTLSASTLPLSIRIDSAECTLSIAIMRRFRKQAVRRSSLTRQLILALQAASEIGVQAKEISMTTNKEYQTIVSDAETLHKEAQTMVYTVFKEILEREQPHGKEESVILLPQVTDMLSAVIRLNVLKKQDDNSPQDVHWEVQSLWYSLLLYRSPSLFERASLGQMARFVRVVESTESNELSLPPQIMRHLGERFLKEVTRLNKSPRGLSCLEPKSTNSILRLATLKWGNNETVMEPFLGSATMILTNEKFLANCHASELTHFLTFLEKTRSLHTEIGLLKSPLLQVGKRILEHDVLDVATPSQASSILSSFSTVITEHSRRQKDQNDFSNRIKMEDQLLADLFHGLGGQLLTSSPGELSCKDISSALCAYAKASYVHDMGIFDHLAALLASRIEDCNIRQVAQSLWACGKMALWEQQLEKNQHSKNYSENPIEPPYLPSAEEFALYLSQHKNNMTSKDVAQTIWALGRLQSVHKKRRLDPAVTIDMFLSRAVALAPRFTSQEIANILWGMNKAGWTDCQDSIQPFVDRLFELRSTSTNTISPQEAANVLLALGRMRVKDESLFELMSKGILEQLDVTSAQAIANALWAHKAVNITPPRELLDRWALERLGLKTVEGRRKS